MPGGFRQGVASLAHVQEGERPNFAQPQGNIQISQADVAVDAQYAPAALGQSRGDTGADRCFTRAALTGQHSDQFPHTHSSDFEYSVIIMRNRPKCKRILYSFWSMLCFFRRRAAGRDGESQKFINFLRIRRFSLLHFPESVV